MVIVKRAALKRKRGQASRSSDVIILDPSEVHIPDTGKTQKSPLKKRRTEVIASQDKEDNRLDTEPASTPPKPGKKKRRLQEVQEEKKGTSEDQGPHEIVDAISPADIEVPTKKRKKVKHDDKDNQKKECPTVDHVGLQQQKDTEDETAEEGVPGVEVHMQNCPGYLQDHHIYEAFAAIGGQKAIAKIKMETRKNTGTFLRSAFIKFYTKELAIKAMAMKPLEVKGKEVRLSWPKPHVEQHSLDLYLSGWPKSARDSDIYDHYVKLGPSAVKQIRWLPSKWSSYSCFVQFSDEKQRDRALAAGSFTFGDATITVQRPMKTLPLSERKQVQQKMNERELFIEPCFSSITDANLLTHYSALGPAAVVGMRRFNNRAWVVFQTPELALQAARMPPPPELKVQNVRIKVNRPKGTNLPKNTTDLPQDATDLPN